MATDSLPQAGWHDRAAATIDPSLPRVVLPAPIVLEVFAHARECYPEECCGLFIGSVGGPPGRAVRCTNVQGLRHSRGESRLDARHGFWIDELEQQQVLRAAEADGEVLLAIYHSHVDTAAYFSHTDLGAAIGPDGGPIWPGVAQLVVSVQDGEVQDCGYFEWDSDGRCYTGRGIEHAP